MLSAKVRAHATRKLHTKSQTGGNKRPPIRNAVARRTRVASLIAARERRNKDAWHKQGGGEKENRRKLNEER